ncbi:hypothetical protein ALC57_02822 [Trachymyrmex cornetzi]|uniref:DUF4806 domain-containing protein n=1 Tax=Trachymyrmex cornetzi TaxID=471704 RepID=A0A195EHL2_9HYME|nr:hypothetical protein ALC57_02822 [Trachymyrmex cornetzi]
MKPYAVVKFRGKEEIMAVVPSSWINEDKLSCKWPSKKFCNHKIARFIMSLKEPTSEFNNHPATVMHEYDNYRDALKACKLADDNSNLNTTAGETDLEKRKKRKIKRLYEKSNDEPSEKAKQMTKKIIHSDSDKDNKILNAQEIKERVTELLNKKEDCPKKNNESGNLPVKNSFLKYDNNNIIHDIIFLTFQESNDRSADFNIAIKDAALRTKQRFNNSLPTSEESEPIASSSQLEINTLSEYDSNNEKIVSEGGTDHYDIKTLLAKPSLRPSPSIKNAEILCKLALRKTDNNMESFLESEMIARQPTTENSSSTVQHVLIDFPVTNLNNLKSIERKLKEEETFNSTVVDALHSQIEGKSLQKMVNSVLRIVLDDKLARLFTWKNQRGTKLQLSKRQISQTMIGSG